MVVCVCDINFPGLLETSGSYPLSKLNRYYWKVGLHLKMKREIIEGKILAKGDPLHSITWNRNAK